MPRNYKVSIYWHDMFTEYPYQENIVGRITDKDLNKIAKSVKGDDLIAFTRGKRYSILAKLFLRDPTLIFLLGKLLKK